MKRVAIILIAIALVALMQCAIFSNLTFGISLMPLPYIALIILLPINTSQFEMILWGLLLGVAVDFAEGYAGLNTIATLAVSYLRVHILNWTLSKDEISLGGIPTILRIRPTKLIRYTTTMVVLHSTIIFILESMNISMLQALIKPYVLSLVLTLIFVWIFTTMVSMATRNYSN